LTYFKNNFLSLQIQHEEWDKWTTCFSIPNVVLPPIIYLGFSAHTGDVADEHDIISISTHNAVWHEPTGKEPSKKRGIRGRNRGGSSSSGASAIGGFLYALIKWLFLAVILVIAVIVFRGYRMKKSAKRF